MSRKGLLILFLAGLVVGMAAAAPERVPGYMDADYYYAGALRLVSGQGASEPYLWNYLNDPAGLPAPSFSYWMPMISIVSAAGLALAQSTGFWAARFGLILLSACVPPLTACLSYRLSGKVASAHLAGLLALFPGFYLAYTTTTDAFALYMVFGSLFLLLYSASGRRAHRIPAELRLVGLGLLAGLLHLTRADGLLWLAGAGMAAWFLSRQLRIESQRKVLPGTVFRLVVSGLAVLAGYALVTAPWYARNLRVWGSLLPPGGSRAMWITQYEQTMIYPASLLTPQAWLAAGWGVHLQAWWSALANNFQTALAVQGGILLFPFILVGMWKLRGCAEVRLGALMWLLTAGVMTFVFPYAGQNGGFFHSGAALQPMLWAVVPAGVEQAMTWYVQKRRIGSPQSMVRFMSAVLLIVMVVLSGLLYYKRVVGSGSGEWTWLASNQHYHAVESTLAGMGALPGEAVLVNNPPGYWLASRRPAAVIPYGDEHTLLAAAQRVGARYIILEQNNPWQLSDLYHQRVNPPELEYLTSVGTTRLYRVQLASGDGGK